MNAVLEVGGLAIGTPDPEAKRLIELYKHAQQIRMPYEADWRRVAELALPREHGGWVTTNAPSMSSGSGAARQARLAQFDSTLARSISKFGAVAERVMTPNSQIYHIMRPSNLRLLRSRAVREYYDTYNELLFSYRYNPLARFQSTQGQVYRSFASYGQAVKMVTWRESPLNQGSRSMYRGTGRKAGGGFVYRTIPFRNMYWMTDHEEQINLWFRRIDWTARQAVEALGERCPTKIKQHYEQKGSADMTRTFEFCQIVMPTREYDEHSFDFRRFPLSSLYLFVEDPQIVKEPSGYHSLPIIAPRHYTEDGCPYAYSLAQQVLSTVGTVNAQVKTMLKVGQKQADPPLLARDDGILNGNVDITPAAVNYGGIDANGREMIKALQVGNLQVAEKLLESQQADIKDGFFTTLFEMIKDRPQMTTTEVLQYAVDNAAQLSPLMGLLQEGDLGPQIEREVDLLEQHGLAPEKPAEILDNPEYDMVYTSPLAKMARGESVKGFVTVANMAMEYFKATQDIRPLRQLNFDAAMPEIADLNSVPARWMNSPEQVNALMAEEKQQRVEQQQVDTAPAVASLIKSASSNAAKPAAA